MAVFPELGQYLDPSLTLTVLGREYAVPLPSAELGLWCRAMASIGASLEAATPAELETAVDRAVERTATLPPLPDGERRSFEETLLGAAYGTLMADRVPDPYIMMCARTTYVWIVAGEEAAERYWRAGGRPEAMGPTNRAERRAQARTAGTGGGAANGTHTPGSTSGTNGRRRSGRRRRGSGSRGSRS